MIEITYTKALDLLKKAVDENGADYIYKKVDGLACQYFEESYDPATDARIVVPSCLVGNALNRAGLEAQDVLDAHMNEESVCEIADYFEELGIMTITSKARTLFMQAQVSQDDGFPWGDAVRDGIELASGYNEDGTFDLN